MNVETITSLRYIANLHTVGRGNFSCDAAQHQSEDISPVCFSFRPNPNSWFVSWLCASKPCDLIEWGGEVKSLHPLPFSSRSNFLVIGSAPAKSQYLSFQSNQLFGRHYFLHRQFWAALGWLQMKWARRTHLTSSIVLRAKKRLKTTVSSCSSLWGKSIAKNTKLRPKTWKNLFKSYMVWKSVNMQSKCQRICRCVCEMN